MPTEKQIKAFLTKIRAQINEHGWIVQGVVPAKDGDLGFAYTVGLTLAGLPELVISGLWREQGQQFLNIAAQQHCREEILAGDTIEDIASVPFRVIDVPLAEVNTARRLYGRSRVRALQLVWPDDNGLWPGSVFAASAMEGRQELLGPAWW